jgi:hypothetical protein
MTFVLTRAGGGADLFGTRRRRIRSGPGEARRAVVFRSIRGACEPANCDGA